MESANINPHAILFGLDYSHLWTTDVRHIWDIHDEAAKHKGRALELGSYMGHSTLALALAGLDVTVYDIDTTMFPYRRDLLKRNGFKAKWINNYSQKALDWEQQDFTVIFHDAEHGNQIIPELVEMWDKLLLSGGVLIVHDTEQLNMFDLANRLGHPVIKSTRDERNRELSMFWKP